MGDQLEPAGLIEPIGFEFGETGLRSTGSGDGDEKSFGLAEAGSMGLHEGAEASAQEVSLVRFASATTGDEPRAQGVEQGISERAEDHEAAGLGLTRLAHAGEVATLLHAAFARESHRWAEI